MSDNWGWTTIGEAFRLVGGGTPSTKNVDYWSGQMPWLSSADIHLDGSVHIHKYVSDSGIADSATNVVPKDTVLFVSRVGVGKVAMAPTDLTYSQDFQGLIPRQPSILPAFAMWYLRHTAQVLSAQSQGTTISGITKKVLAKHPFPLVHFDEQERIVARIEELMSDVDAALADLRTAEARLPSLATSALRHAVMLGLSSEQRSAAGWRMEPLGSLGTWAGGATPSKSNPKYWEDGTIPWVTSKDMKRLVIGDSQDHITQAGVDGSACSQIPASSLLFVMRSGILQHTFPVAITSAPVTVNQDLKALTPRQGLEARYLLFSILAHREHMRRLCMKDGTTVQSIEFSALKDYEIPVPPTTDEQTEAANRAEAVVEANEYLADAVNELPKRAAALRQSILKSAFDGRLV